jgi:CRP-like cAMP-binding protein
MDAEESSSLPLIPPQMRALAAAFVSCDIVGHSKVQRQQTQLQRVAGINNIVRSAMHGSRRNDIVWASGGDGGHVIFQQEDWHQAAVDLIVALHRWANQELVPLRITAHHGSIHEIEGADGRTQPVGDGINTAGWILTRGSPVGVVVSSHFKSEVEQHLPSHADFHDPRWLEKDSQESEQLFLMSVGDLSSQWEEPLQTDRYMLSEASDRESGWDVIYYAKRIMQVNTSDIQAQREILKLQPSDLKNIAQASSKTVARVNPFLGYLDSKALWEVVQLGELIERQYNEVLCQFGDKGDTMFVILRGQIGVFNPEGQPAANALLPAFVQRQGEIVGELAFALGRERTADLVALGEVVLLSFNIDQIERRLPQDRAGAEAQERISRFITSRVLEHTCYKVSYLIGRDRTGPLAKLATDNWPLDMILRELLYQVRLIPYGKGRLSLEGLGQQDSGSDKSEGLFFLVSGTLRSVVNEAKVLNGEDFPLLYVDLSETLIAPDHYFVVEKPGRVLQIEKEAFDDWTPETQQEILKGIKRELASRYSYDVFFAYNFEDREIVERWYKALVDEGFRVFKDAPQPAHRFPRRIEAALLDSLTLAAFVSSHTMVKPQEDNWVLREIQYWQDYFDEAKILPIRLPGGKPELIVHGYPPVDATANESDAIGAVVQVIRDIQSGVDDPPIRTLRKEHIGLD